MTGEKKGKTKGDMIRKDTDMDTPRASRREKDVVTEGSEESFPASDPPSFMAGGAIAGSPATRPVEDVEPASAGKKPSASNRR